MSLVVQLFITRLEWETENQPMIEQHDIDHGAEENNEDNVPGPDP